MRSSLLAACLLPAGLVCGQLVVVDYDESLEGRVGEQLVEEEVVGTVHADRKFSYQMALQNKPIHDGVYIRDSSPAVDVGDLLGKRQFQTCDAGYWYCPQFGRCCPTTTRCCSYGYCLPAGKVCCPTGPCRSGETCCGSSNCVPVTGECCRDGSHCEAGNHCYYNPLRGAVCCTDSSCTAYVENGRTTSAPTSTTTRTFQITSTQYYYWTVTWYYYYYYWTYYIDIQASVVTSTRSTATTTFSVRTTDAAAASDYFSSVSQTLTLPTPAAATTLADLAGKTSYVSTPAEPSQTEPEPSSPPTIPTQDEPEPSSPPTNSQSNGGGNSGNSSDSGNGGSGDEVPTPTARSGGGGNQASGVSSLLSSLNKGTLAWALFGGFTGVLAVML